MKLVHYLSLTVLLLVTLTSPTLLASVPVSIDPDGDSLTDSRNTDEDDNGVHFQVVFSFHLAKALPKNAKCSTQEAVLQEYFSAKVASSSGVGLNNILSRTQTIT